jgi:hypothetical protein
LEGVTGSQREYIEWTLTTCAAAGVRVDDVLDLKLPRFRGVFDAYVDYGSVVTTSIAVSNAIGER